MNTRSVFIPGPAPWGFRTAENPLRIIRVRNRFWYRPSIRDRVQRNENFVEINPV